MLGRRRGGGSEKMKMIKGGVPVELIWLFGCLVGCVSSTYLFGVERLMVSVWRYLRGFLRKRPCGAKICCARASAWWAPSFCNDNLKFEGWWEAGHELGL